MPKVNQLSEEIIIDEEGTVKGQVRTTSYRLPDEPPYVKLYLDTILYLKDLPKSYNPVLLAILQRMPWANQIQDIAINSSVKRQISKELDVSVSRIDHALTDFVKGEILFRMDVGLYRINPHLFGRGEWGDIERLRLEVTFDSTGKTIKGQIEKRKQKKEEQIPGQMEFIPASAVNS